MSVFDRQGNPVTGMAPGDFHGNAQGKEVSVLSVTAAGQPPRIVILLDASDSMFQDKAKWGLALETVDDMVRRGPAESEIGLVLFSDTAEVAMPLTVDHPAILNYLASLREKQHFERLRQAAKGTALLDAVLRALEILEPARPGDGIYVISDGQDTTSRTKEKETRRRLGCAGVRMFAFVLATTRSVHRYARGTGPLQEMVETSGGQLVVVEGEGNPVLFYFSEAEVRKVREMYSIMERFYRLEIAVAPSVKERTWRLAGVDKAGRPRTDLQLIYPRRLPPCR